MGSSITHEDYRKPEEDRSREAMRRCLRCGRQFRSAHPGNRRCKQCAYKLARYGELDISPYDPASLV